MPEYAANFLLYCSLFYFAVHTAFISDVTIHIRALLRMLVELVCPFTYFTTDAQAFLAHIHTPHIFLQHNRNYVA